MYSIRIRRHIMIAHSLKRAVFGPAQKLHGATYVVDAEFKRDRLDENNIVMDIDLASQLLEKVLQPLNYQNLDELPQFQGKLTTTEFLCRYIHGAMGRELDRKFEGRLKVTLGESHVAWASYENELGG